MVRVARVVTDDLPFGAPTTAPNLGAPAPRRCRRHSWVTRGAPGQWTTDLGTNEKWFGDRTECFSCGVLRDPVASRRGRTSLRAGKDAERAIAKAYGGKRTGQFGGPDDVLVGELFVVQSKAGGWFSNRYWDELAKLPRSGGRVPTLIVSDRPGPGRGRTRRLVVRTLEDDVALHGTLAGVGDRAAHLDGDE